MADDIRSHEVQDDQQSVSASSDIQPLDDANNSFSDVSLASLGPPRSPARPVSRLSRRTLAEHQAATNGNGDYLHRANGELQDLAGSLQDSIPEMLRIKDLDSGKEYNLDKVLIYISTCAFVVQPDSCLQHAMFTIFCIFQLHYWSQAALQLCQSVLLLATRRQGHTWLCSHTQQQSYKLTLCFATPEVYYQGPQHRTALCSGRG